MTTHVPWWECGPSRASMYTGQDRIDEPVTTCDGPTCHEHDGVMSHGIECSMVTPARRAELRAQAESLGLVEVDGIWRNAEDPAQPEG